MGPVSHIWTTLSPVRGMAANHPGAIPFLPSAITRSTVSIERMTVPVSPDHPFWQSRIVRLAPALLCMAAIFALSSRSELPQPSSISGEVFSIMGHFGAYFGLGVTLWWALGLGRFTTRARVLLAWGAAVLYGISDEFHQSFVPNRTPDVRDVLVDAAGAIVGIAVAMLIARWLASRETSFDGA